MKSLRALALGALCVLMLSALRPVNEANAFPLALSGNGSGTASGTCTSSCNLNAGVIGKFIGKSSMTLTLTGNGSGGTCSTATGIGQISTANKSTITFQTVGALCDVGDNALTYNASYFITGGNAHFPGAAGTGLFLASVDGSGNLIVTLSGGLIK